MLNRHFSFTPDQHDQVEQLMSRGFNAQSQDNREAACLAWGKLWQMIQTICSHTGADYHDLASVYHGEHNLLVWIENYAAELDRLASASSAWNKIQRQFCLDYMNCEKDRQHRPMQNRMLELSLTYYREQDEKQGRSWMEQGIALNPDRSWLWLKYAEQYAAPDKRSLKTDHKPGNSDEAFLLLGDPDRSARRPNDPGKKDRKTEDPDEAVRILKRALGIQGLDQRKEVTLRLRDLYIAMNLPDLAEGLFSGPVHG